MLSWKPAGLRHSNSPTVWTRFSDNRTAVHGRQRLTVGQPEVHYAREIPNTAVRTVCGFASEDQRDKQMNGRSLLGFCIYVPRDREGGATLAGTDQAAFLQGF